jgi:transcription-repair coupling factor (superfamily II helicase)
MALIDCKLAPRQRYLISGIPAQLQATWMAATLQAAPHDRSLIACRQTAQASALYQQLLPYSETAGLGKLLYLPDLPDVDLDPFRHQGLLGERLSCLHRLAQYLQTPLTLITCTAALRVACVAPQSFTAQQRILAVGDCIQPQELVNSLLQQFDYASEIVCEVPGQIAQRGGLIDVYPIDAKHPVRIDFFDDEIESIRAFDPVTQRSLHTLDGVCIHSMQLLSPAQQTATLDHYLQGHNHNWIFPSDPNTDESNYDWQQLVASKLQAQDTVLAFNDGNFTPTLFKRARRVDCDILAYAEGTTDAITDLPQRDPYLQAQLERGQWRRQVQKALESDPILPLIVSTNAEMEKRIQKEFAVNAFRSCLKPQFIRGPLTRSFAIREAPNWLTPSATEPWDQLCLIAASEYLNDPAQHKDCATASNPSAKKSPVSQDLDFNQLVEGDFLVHLQHGIGIYRGLTKLNTGTAGNSELLSIEFANQVTIHLPLHESHLLNRYVGIGKKRPKLSKIGTSAWNKTLRAAEQSSLDYAAELLNAHAQREQAHGFAYPESHPWETEFAARFPHQETPDQLAAIHATFADMEHASPMDRLICGDVGFGKTEVAIRAIFKAVLAGKQVALLAPTTVLCQQHYENLCQRLQAYPIIVEQMSRYRSHQANKASIGRLIEGQIDILVGTHRLLSQDVQFKDLGLLVIDEEQRFGVRQKERLKQLQINVDLLTLSATPIPRTLHLALSGARSMSLIESPPAERKPIITQVKPYSESLIKSAIGAELDRGGQVFYLHNQVHSIDAVAERIRRLLPSARVGIGHGQMEASRLERIMTQFVAGKFDVLVCTTVIESGIDIPNCNTLIIEGADRFGLAQLYQIRGRVGRFNRQAYAYLLLHRHAALVASAQKRLQTLKQHNQLGAGFRIAMRDLELRGAGNLLGAKQSGHVSGVGFELYCHLLQKSVAKLQGQAPQQYPVEIKLDFIHAGVGSFGARSTQSVQSNAVKCNRADLPHAYIPEPSIRIEIYRRLSGCADCDAVNALQHEIKDRFGALPAAVCILIEITKVRVLAQQAQVVRVLHQAGKLMCSRRGAHKTEHFIKSGSRFPRLTQRDPVLNLREIQKFLNRHARL